MPPIRHELTEDHKEANREVVIVAGGAVGDWALPILRGGNALLAGADRGALFLIRSGFIPDAALGDFDSVTEAEREEIRSLSRMYADCDPIRKDLTDTEWALEWAISLRPSSIVLLGATGTRLDHTLANVQLLKKAADAGIPCRLIDAHNEIRMLSGNQSVTLSGAGYSQVSLLPMSETASGITLEGFRYPLQDAVLTIGQTLGISNVITAREAVVRLKSGLLLVIQSRD